MPYVPETRRPPFLPQVVGVGRLPLCVGPPEGERVESENEQLLVIDARRHLNLIGAAETGGLRQITQLRIAEREQSADAAR